MRRFPLRDILTATATRETELKNLQNREQVAFAFGRGIEGPFGSLSFVEVDGIGLLLAAALAKTHGRTLAAQLVRVHWPVWLHAVSVADAAMKPSLFCIADFIERSGRAAHLACGSTAEFDQIAEALAAAPESAGLRAERLTCINLTRLCEFQRVTAAQNGIDMLDRFLPPPDDPRLQALLAQGADLVEDAVVAVRLKKNRDALARAAGQRARALAEEQIAAHLLTNAEKPGVRLQ